MDRALSALNRFGLGARVGEREALRDPRGWLHAQLDGDPPTVTVPESATDASIGDALRALRGLSPEDQLARQQARRRLTEIAFAESRAVLSERISSTRPFAERLVAFWSNHLCVSAAAKILVLPLAGSYEREAIRPHVFGRFEDMVLASAKHPAMLAYLDAFQSIGPGSAAARLSARISGNARGLNENYARELMELHTIGVNGGYTQDDVRELAKILTGWTVDGLRARPGQRAFGSLRRRTRWLLPDDSEAGTPLRFAFRQALHEPGNKVVLGVTYAEGGADEGEQAIRRLCRHRATATFVATKLVRHFVRDDPPASCIEGIARVFRSSGGDLRAVSRALVDAPEAWASDARKFRTPQDWVVAILRALDVRAGAEPIPIVLRQLRHPLWGPSAPKGFGDTLQEWGDSDSLLNRAELSRTIGRRLVASAIDPRSLLDVVDVPAEDPLQAWLSDRSIAPAERVALALAAPAFQWR